MAHIKHLAHPLLSLILAWLMLVVPTLASADVTNDLNKFMGKFGLQSNVQMPNVYQSQRAGSVVGGGLSSRIPYDATPLVYSKLPSVGAGCEGIDFSLGAFSFLSMEQMVEKLKRIGMNAAGYAFSLAIAYYTPTIHGVLDKLEKASTLINQINKDSCAAGRMLVNNTMDTLAANDISKCAAAGTGDSSQDRTAAMQKCSQNPRAFAKNGPSDPEDGVVDVNPLWEIMKAAKINSADPKEDQQVKEMMMSMLGGYIHNGAGQLPTSLQPTIDLKQMLGSSMTSSPAPLQVWACDEPVRCLKPTVVNVNWTPYQSQVAARMRTLYGKLAVGTQPDQADQDFINSTPFPLYSLLSAIHLTFGDIYTGSNSPDGYIERYSIIMATDIVRQYLYRMQRVITNGSYVVNIPSKAIEDVEKSMRLVEKSFELIIKDPNYPNAHEVTETLKEIQSQLSRRVHQNGILKAIQRQKIG